jgi:hypothetical protein
VNPEALYEALISEIPQGIRVLEAFAGASHSIVVTEAGIGTVMTLDATGQSPILPADLKGYFLRDVARAILSWNAVDAALGGAALNAYYNSPPVLRKHFGYEMPAAAAGPTTAPADGTVPTTAPAADPFARYAELARGKQVASIGHFASVERHIDPVAASLFIIEEHQREGDYPAAAAEFILPRMDMVFITGSTLANKTLPRLLELSRHAFVVLVGPSTCMAPLLFDYGVNVVSGTLYTDREGCLSMVRQGLHGKMVHNGQKLSFEKE